MDATDFVALAQPGIRALQGYDPGLDLVALRLAHGAGELLELGSNETSHGPSPAARAAGLGPAGRRPRLAARGRAGGPRGRVPGHPLR